MKPHVSPSVVRSELLVERQGGILRLSLNRPERRNALSRSLLGLLEEVLRVVATDREARVVVLAARGPVFCSGHDLGEMTGRSEAEYRDLFEICSRVMLMLRRLPQPVIARVQGVATAAGCQLVAACDLAVAVEEATFATPGVKIGLFCTTPMVPLVRAIPDKAALEMLFTGGAITARGAYELGLVNRVVPAGALDEAVAELCRAIIAMSPTALGLGKEAFYELRALDEETAYKRAIDVMTGNALRPDAQEGIAAFLEAAADVGGGMSLPSFTELFWHADARRAPVAVAVAGAADPSVLKALETALAHEWVAPILVGNEAAIHATAETIGVPLRGFTIVPAEGEAIAAAAVAEVRQGRAALLMKGRISTPGLLQEVLDPALGLRTGRVVCQVVLMDVHPAGRRFLMADTGICVAPNLARRIDILNSTVEVAHALGAERPRAALMAATEKVNAAMPETLHAAELQRRNEQGEFPGCTIQGPLSFDLAYAAEAADAKQIGGAVIGAADAMVFPNLVSANLTVKAIMYTADCRYGGVLRGTAVPIVFMSRADTPATRLNSLALALRLLAV